VTLCAQPSTDGRFRLSRLRGSGIRWDGSGETTPGRVLGILPAALDRSRTPYIGRCRTGPLEKAFDIIDDRGKFPVRSRHARGVHGLSLWKIE